MGDIDTEKENNMKHNLLNGKCLEAYLKWYKEVFAKEHNIHDDGMSINYMPFSMAYGVLVDFFDSVGICINRLRPYSFEIQYGWNIIKYNCNGIDGARNEARTKAIEKANEIYNAK